MADHYFADVLKSLDTKVSTNRAKLDFVTLKGYEYWIRALRSANARPDVEDCMGVFPRANAKNILKKLSKHFQSENRLEDENPKKAKIESLSKSFVRGSFFDDDDECLKKVENKSEL